MKFILDPEKYSEALEKLTDEQLGTLTRALMKYCENGETPSFYDQTLEVAFVIIRKDIDKAAERHKARCQRNRENAQKRWMKRRKACKAETSSSKEPKTEKSSTHSSAPINYNALLAYWNKRVGETGSKMPTIARIDNNRRRLLAARLKEYGNTRYLQAAFEQAFVSPYLNGKNKSQWVANIDWILAAGNFSRVLDGVFSPKREKSDTIQPTTAPVSQETLSRERAERAAHEVERQRKAVDRQRDNIMLAIKAAERDPNSIQAKIAYIAYNDGTMTRLGICWTPPVTHHDAQPGNRKVAQ